MSDPHDRARHHRANLRRAAVAAAVGLLFGSGLALGGMTDPRVVLGFLDLAGAWDPRLAFVMLGGLAVSAAGVALAKRRGRSLFDDPLQLPTHRNIDARLIGGAALFGIGWGLAGYCPGPGLVALATNPAEALVFLPAMLTGSWLARVVAR